MVYTRGEYAAMLGPGSFYMQACGGGLVGGLFPRDDKTLVG